MIKDMAGVGSPARIRRLVDAFLQRHPQLLILYHRHSTDGLVMPAMAAAAEAGARLFDVTDDAFSRFYGHPPVRPLVRYLRELGHEVHFDMKRADEASEIDPRLHPELRAVRVAVQGILARRHRCTGCRAAPSRPPSSRRRRAGSST